MIHTYFFESECNSRCTNQQWDSKGSSGCYLWTNVIPLIFLLSLKEKKSSDFKFIYPVSIYAKSF